MKIFTTAMATAFFLTITGCNTVAGVGKDVEKVGEKTQEVSKDVSNDLKKKK